MANESMVTLYKSISAKLDLICKEEADEINHNNNQIKLHNSQVSKQIQTLDSAISEFVPYKTTASAYVTQEILRKTYPPRENNIDILENMYRKASQGGGDWTAIYSVASSAIAYLELKKQRILSTSVQTASDSTIIGKASAKCEQVLRSKDVEKLLSLFRQYSCTF